MNDYVALVLGVVCAGAGGELFVRGTVGIAYWARVSPGIVGATVAAFATSSPELSVAINSAMLGKPQIALGDALGSNVVNVALIFAIALLISGIRSPRDAIKRDFPVALVVPVITGTLLLDGVLSRIDGLLLLTMFFLWLVAAIVDARRQRSAAAAVLGEHRGRLMMLFCAVGFAFLVTAGHLIVTGARGITLRLGIDEFVIGATVVAIGTSVPELATTVIAKLRGHDEVALGTILGSNIFNGLLVVSVAAVIFPISVNWQEVLVALVFGFLAVVFALPMRNGFAERRRGALLLILYGAYLTAVLHPNAAQLPIADTHASVGLTPAGHASAK
jgi:cation:H+ antiporter